MWIQVSTLGFMDQSTNGDILDHGQTCRDASNPRRDPETKRLLSGQHEPTKLIRREIPFEEPLKLLTCAPGKHVGCVKGYLLDEVQQILSLGRLHPLSMSFGRVTTHPSI